MSKGRSGDDVAAGKGTGEGSTEHNMGQRGLYLSEMLSDFGEHSHMSDGSPEPVRTHLSPSVPPSCYAQPPLLLLFGGRDKIRAVMFPSS